MLKGPEHKIGQGIQNSISWKELMDWYKLAVKVILRVRRKQWPTLGDSEMPEFLWQMVWEGIKGSESGCAEMDILSEVKDHQRIMFYRNAMGTHNH